MTATSITFVLSLVRRICFH